MTTKKIMVMCFGTFDCLHPGHLSYFSQAKLLGDYLVAVVARDSSVMAIKHKKPRQNETTRLQAVSQCDLVDQAVLGDQYDKLKVIRDMAPAVLALGYDQKADVDKINQLFPAIKVVRLKAFYPEKYKSSLMALNPDT